MDVSRASDEDQTTGISSSRATRQNLNGSSSIERIRFKRNDSHPSVSSTLLMKDLMPNPTVTPKCTYLYTCSLMKNILLDVSSKLNYLDN